MRPPQLLEKNEDIQDAFASLVYREEVDASMDKFFSKSLFVSFTEDSLRS